MEKKKPAVPKRPVGRPRKKPIVAKRKVRVAKNSHLALEKYRPITVELQTLHRINGQEYGPGTIKVKGNLGRLLQEMDRRVITSERELFTQKARYVVSTHDGRVISVPVPPNSFDDERNQHISSL